MDGSCVSVCHPLWQLLCCTFAVPDLGIWHNGHRHMAATSPPNDAACREGFPLQRSCEVGSLLLILIIITTNECHLLWHREYFCISAGESVVHPKPAVRCERSAAEGEVWGLWTRWEGETRQELWLRPLLNTWISAQSNGRIKRNGMLTLVLCGFNYCKSVLKCFTSYITVRLFLAKFVER